MAKRTICYYLDCKEEVRQGFESCNYHLNGGPFGSGETYERYQIIEQDFIDFIKNVPLDESHFDVYSPVLRDIIIRTCTEIEIFFKEWSKQICSGNNENPLWEEYKKKRKGVIGKERNWTFGSYFYFNEVGYIQDVNILYVRSLDKNISPFEGWESKSNPPIWWEAYNSIKHNGLAAKKDANYGVALFAIGALFLLHCLNRDSRSYLREHTFPKLKTFIDKVTLEENLIVTPIDSRSYLFRYNSGIRKKIELVSSKELKKKLDRIKKK